ncbi:hypothetical protein MBRA1_003633 [Malassezia brasiliensis]|uniref:Uncharacterized protein n=1 Tax=Malassezia brasiliensis TaxID=1821822 RepID=A0AAF0DX20_9BASI|nr:hypothetical protein MBRA1_003633 [Malassezia brasiliensis]
MPDAMLVPRSVAGTKRRAPPPRGAARADAAAVRVAAGDVHVASALVFWLAPGAPARRSDALADALRRAQDGGVHAARLVRAPEVAAVCTSLAELVGALALVAQLHWLWLDGYVVHCAPPAAVRGVFVVRAPLTQEHAVERAAPVLDVACTLRAAAAAAGVPAPHVYAVLPPTPGPLDEAAAPGAEVRLRSASVVLEARAADVLCAAYAWDGAPAVRSAPEAVVQAVYAGLRVLPHEVFCARAAEYDAWQRTLVARNVQAARARAQAVRAPAAECPAAECPAAEPGAGALADGTAYPVGTLVVLAPTPGVDAAAYRTAFSRLVPNGIDYVDVRAAVHVRCATPDAAARLLAARDPLLAGARRVGGAAEAAYWAALPVRVRNQAVRRARR